MKRIEDHAHIVRHHDGVNEYNAPAYVQTPTKIQRRIPVNTKKTARQHKDDLYYLSQVFKAYGVK